MLKLKSLLSSTFPRMRLNLNQLYSKTAEKLEPVLSLADALGTKKETTSTTVPNPSIDSNILSVDNSQPALAKAGDKAGKTSKSAAKSKKGKKCGQTTKSKTPKKPGPPGGSSFVDVCLMFDKPKPNAKKWRSISYVLVPFALGLSVFVLATKEEMPELDYIPYDFMYKRIKRFAWGEGQKSFFHGPHNFLPQEEEDRLDREAEELPKDPKDQKNQKDQKNPKDPKSGGAGAAGPRYKKRVDVMEEKKKRREQRAEEELERRKKRHAEEAPKEEAAQ